MAKHHEKTNVQLQSKAYQANLLRIPKKEGILKKVISGLFALSLTIYIASNSLSANAESSSTKNFNIPASPLSKGLSSFAGQNGINLSFDPVLTEGKQTNGLKGAYGVSDGFKELLQGTGLQIINDQKGGYFLEKSLPFSIKPLKSNDSKAVEIELSKVKVRAKRLKQLGPLPGLELTKEQIAGNIQSISAKEIKEAHSLSLSDLLNSKLQSVNVNDYQGNPFQMDVTYRGFTASPQLGTPQGLSVFFDGVRVNEPFGDVVNWDMIPMNALGGFDIFPGSNPLFGLNTLGGALSMKTKSGFTDEGVSAEVLTGSYGRKQLQASGGWNNGTIAAFGAVNLFLEDGWRDNSPSEVNQAFGKLEWQGERLSLGLSSLAVINKLKGNGTVPQELYRQDESAVFTSPDETKNKLLQFKLSGAFDVTDNISITGHVYNRNSKRNSTTGDIIDQEQFSNADHTYHMFGTRLPGSVPGIVCAYADDDRDGIPNYYVINEVDRINFLNSLNTATPNYSLLTYNSPLPTAISNGLKTVFKSGVWDVFVNEAIQPTDTQPVFITADQFIGGSAFGSGLQYVDDAGNTMNVFAARPVNDSTCRSEKEWNQGMIPTKPYTDRDGVNGYTDKGLSTGTGVIEGTPTAVITNSDIQQEGKGAALQLNFNFDEHKFMLGGSIDKAYASYVGKSRLALLDDKRNVFSDASKLGEEFYAADHDLTINDFSGTSTTKSLYFSETWSPQQTLNFSFSARYNKTDIDNTLAPTKAERRLEDLLYQNRYPYAVICPGSDLSNCPYSLDQPIDAITYWNTLVLEGFFPKLSILDKPAREKFSYHSLNPSIGGTWQAKPNLNLYANWNQGTRAPSVIELGCAYDATPVGPSGTPRSLVDGRGCKLPSSLSGDPYLPQVKAQTLEAGARGKFGDFLEWNMSAYRTNVKDDINMVSVTSDLSFFQDIGKTRRQGIEFGLAGEYGKSDFRINYSLTEATFQSYFKTISPNNSSRGFVPGSDFDMIQVKPGNVMPGVPFNNMNFNWGYKFTPKLKVNLNMVAHSGSFLRGNENNAHTPSPGKIVTFGDNQIKTPDNNYSGTAPGYAVLNLNGRYDLGSGWATTVLINNVLDKKYYTAGRLGITPFAPSTYGAIGPGGFNYNSSEWIPTQFISAGAPRGVWAAISYDFDAAQKSKKPSLNTVIYEPDRSELPISSPTPEQMAVNKALDKVKMMPVLKLNTAKAQVKAAEQEVRSQVEKAHLSQAGKDNTTTLSDLVVSAQGLKIIAVFNETSALTEKESKQIRKMQAFEQKDGQWRVIKEQVISEEMTKKTNNEQQNQTFNENEKKHQSIIKAKEADLLEVNDLKHQKEQLDQFMVFSNAQMLEQEVK